MSDLISREEKIDAIDVLKRNYPSSCFEDLCKAVDTAIKALSAQPEIIRCKDCKYGIQDKWGLWYCMSLGCQIGDEDGNGFCSDAERRTE